PGVASVDLVDEESSSPGRVRNEHVRIAVVIDVAEGSAPPDLGELERGARAYGHVLEPAIPQIAIELVPHPDGKGIFCTCLRLDRGHAAVGGVQVEPAIVVEIKPPG